MMKDNEVSEEDIKLLKLLKALDNSTRLMIIEFILNHKEQNLETGVSKNDQD